jgi:hypothetical protein
MAKSEFEELYFDEEDAYGTDARVSTEAYQELGFDICESDDMDYVTMTFPTSWQ